MFGLTKIKTKNTFAFYYKHFSGMLKENQSFFTLLFPTFPFLYFKLDCFLVLTIFSKTNIYQQTNTLQIN